ncbi:MAG: hypothetical protein ACNYPH_00665 [Gammaproteobacteria bacterium WSBS_2016_MAG_OTU1]
MSFADKFDISVERVRQLEVQALQGFVATCKRHNAQPAGVSHGQRRVELSTKPLFTGWQNPLLLKKDEKKQKPPLILSLPMASLLTFSILLIYVVR